MDDYASDVLSTLDSLGIESAVFAGVSMGGYVAFSVVRQAAHRVSGLMLIDTRETPDSPDAKENRRMQSERVDREGPGFLIEEMLPRMLTSDTLAAGDRRVEIVRCAMASASAEGVKGALGAMSVRPDAADVIRAYPGPILITVGEEDEITPPADAERMAALGTDTTLVRIPGAAHLSNVERPREFNESVTAFLSRVR
jgi:pimeloyl-ACP methyl ester carboxylesterase